MSRFFVIQKESRRRTLHHATTRFLLNDKRATKTRQKRNDEIPSE
jgi:hypothetical protein